MADNKANRQLQARAAGAIEWWTKRCEDDAKLVLPKAVEYSAHDLLVVGQGLVPPGATHAQCVEAGIAFYALGKAARAVGAYREGRLPSDDTWDDLAIYSTMARFTRKFGDWNPELAS